jgi:uncharacterized protein (TIGR01777 family)
MPLSERRTLISAPADEVLAWHARPGALERLLPPWADVRIVERRGGLEPGGRVVLRLRRGPPAFTWEALHEEYEAGRCFVDRQVRGPFAEWRHEHRFVPDGPDRCILEDHVEYRLPTGVGFLVGRIVRRELERMFRFRHCRVQNDIARHAAVKGCGPQRIVVTGSSGLIGRELTSFLTAGGHRVDCLVRRAPMAGTTEIRWDPARGEIDAEALEGADAVVHLAGENIGARRWTPSVKAAIVRSRVDGTALLSETLARLSRPSRVLISASAVGYYGSRGDEPMTEQAEPGDGFLPEVCKAWEAATQPAERAGIRVVKLRTGLVVSGRGGALARMLPVFRLGLGGVLGSGRQVISWIALDDLVGAIYHLIFSDVSGPVNTVSPGPVTNAEFTRILGRVLRRPTLLRVPGFVVGLVFGEMGRTLLLEGARVEPGVLRASGFRFLEPELEPALRTELGLTT